jgi:hypothetical protein
MEIIGGLTSLARRHSGRNFSKPLGRQHKDCNSHQSTNSVTASGTRNDVTSAWRAMAMVMPEKTPATAST